MIISASYKTDIPTFYGDWFMNRLRAGYCKTYNHHNNTVSRIDLSVDAVDGIVFWTKNVGPFVDRLAEIRASGYAFVVQHTINGYPRALESRVTDAGRSVHHLTRIANEFGPRTCVWRYDTIVVTSEMSLDWHVENFARLATTLRGVVDEVVISFVHLYAKTKTNLERAAASYGFSLIEPPYEQKLALVSRLAQIAASNGMSLSICSQPQMAVGGAREARCVDAERLAEISCRRPSARLRGNRKECGCFESRDIGEYDTCPHGCVYCYAVRSDAVAKASFAEHRPDSEFLFSPPASARERSATGIDRQLPLFHG